MAKILDNQFEQRRGFFRKMALAAGSTVVGVAAVLGVSGKTTTYVTPSVPTPVSKIPTGATISRVNVAPTTVPSVRR